MFFFFEMVFFLARGRAEKKMGGNFKRFVLLKSSSRLKGVIFKIFWGLKTLPETNSTSPRENQWLEKDPFRGKLLALGEG